MVLKHILVAIGLILLIRTTSNALIVCYICTSAVQVNCNDPFSPVGIHTCYGGSCYTAKEVSPGLTKVERTCVANIVDPLFCNSSKAGGSAVCICSSNYCNNEDILEVDSDADKPIPHMFHIMILSAAVFLMAEWIK